jgi:hypothetical protein
VLRIEQKELKSTPVLENPVALAFSAVSWRNREASPELSRRIVLCRKATNEGWKNRSQLAYAEREPNSERSHGGAE